MFEALSKSLQVSTLRRGNFFPIQELLRGAILKHLSGRQLSRQEDIKLSTKTYFSFVKQDASRKGFDEDMAVIEIPD